MFKEIKRRLRESIQKETGIDVDFTQSELGDEITNIGDSSQLPESHQKALERLGAKVKPIPPSQKSQSHIPTSRLNN